MWGKHIHDSIACGHMACWLTIAGAHGICGILLILMYCQPELEEVFPGQASAMILDCLNSLLGQRTPSGNLLSSLGSENAK